MDTTIKTAEQFVEHGPKGIVTPFELIIVIGISVLLTIPLGVMCAKSYLRSGADTLMLLQTVESIAEKGIPRNQIYATVHSAIDTFAMGAADVCRLPLGEPQEQEDNPFKRVHPYLIAYVMAPFAKILDIRYAVGLLTATSFVLLLACSYLLCRKFKFPIVLALAFSITIMTHPDWSMGITGQAYADRMFIGLEMLLLYLLSTRDRITPGIILATILACVVTDRTGVIVAMIYMSIALLSRHMAIRKRISYLGAGILSMLYSAYMLFFFMDKAASGMGRNALRSISLSSLLNVLYTPTLLDATYIFLFLNLGVIGVFSFFKWRAAILALAAMSLNIFITMGGGEKTGWSLHYHSMYFPLLVWASINGLAVVRRFSRRSAMDVALVGVLVVMAGYYSLINPYTLPGLVPSVRNIYEFNISRLAIFTTKCIRGEMFPEFKKFHNIIPKEATVCAPEAFQVAVSEGRKVYYYPMGLEAADVAITFINPNDTNIETRYSAAVTYCGRENQAKLDACLFKRMRDAGYNVDNPLILTSPPCAIFTRGHIMLHPE